ncbi:hypothetical protein LTR53_014111 [Teratosphaeriaceae sp. CCFEE 6253]|nr:hypothetical protein LTR53_014111 [Teratosphaeriaceae sp. CCFEE 6253]
MDPLPTLKRPGFGLPLEQMPLVWDRSGKKERFPHAIADYFAIDGVTLREQRMLDFINQISDKPRWWEKIEDREILARWRDEACGTEGQQRTSSAHLNAESFDYCVQELRDKAAYLAKHGVVHVLDVAATVVKADVDDTDACWHALRDAARILEDVPDRLKDWHPGSNGLVLDLLHPSLFPLQYGKSRVLPHGTVTLHQCAEFTGLGEVCPRPAVLDSDTPYSREVSWGNPSELQPWGSFQWLPSEITFDIEGTAKIASYVTNLHPRDHVSLYRALELAVAKAVPLWNECLSWFHPRHRIKVESCGCENYLKDNYPGWPGDNDRDGEEDEDSDEQDEENYNRHNHFEDWLSDHPDERRVLQPSPKGDYLPFEQRLESASDEQAQESTPQNPAAAPQPHPRIDLRTASPTLQVIFKLATIHLTPSNPIYDGSSWHVEGALNEHICATALFYYASDNISDDYLHFRHHIDAEEMEAAEDLFGIANEAAAVQELGAGVRTREGRWIAFPNVMQHRVGRFGLQDASQPGHRKILAMFLVDPHIPILSTANVPPQRGDWWAEEVRKVARFAALPVELFDRIIADVEDFPVGWEEACGMREALMAERGRATEEYEEMLQQDSFFFCEH